MTFFIILLVSGVTLLVLSLVLLHNVYDCEGLFISTAVLGTIQTIVTAALLFVFVCDAKVSKALMAEHLAHPTNYTYTQLADHNRFVTKAKVWQGTIFSFYNDVNLQTIDIDSVSQKIIVKSEDFLELPD